MAASKRSQGFRRRRTGTGAYYRVNRRLSMLAKRSHRKFKGRHLSATRRRHIALAERKVRRMHRTRYGRRTMYRRAAAYGSHLHRKRISHALRGRRKSHAHRRAISRGMRRHWAHPAHHRRHAAAIRRGHHRRRRA
jgi:hypothetical protein